MSILGWIVLGLISGFSASKIVNKTGEGFLLDIVLGIVGAVVGGFVFAQFGAAGVTGFNLYSMFVAVVGAVVVLVIYHWLSGRRAARGARSRAARRPRLQRRDACGDGAIRPARTGGSHG